MPCNLDPRVRFAALVGPGALFILLFLLIPLLSILVFSFWRTENYELIQDWNLNNYGSVLGEWIYLKFLLRSLAMAAAVSTVCLIYAWPCAYLIAKHGGPLPLDFRAAYCGTVPHPASCCVSPQCSRFWAL